MDRYHGLTVAVIILLLLFVASLIFLLISISSVSSIQSGVKGVSSLHVALISAFAVLIGSTITAVVRPLVEKINIQRLKAGVDEPLRPQKNTIRILLVGPGRSGKTSFINNLGFFTEIKNLKETEAWKIYAYYYEEAEAGKKVKLMLGDYRGQNPGMLFENFDSFAGQRGERMINCLFFVVDLYPEDKRTEEGYQSRVKENIDFLNIFALQSLFYLSYSKKNFRSVALFINKLDLLPYEDEKSDDVYQQEERALELYKPLIELIKKFCEAKNLPFVVKAGSALKGSNVRALYSEILRNCLEVNGERKHEW